MKKLNKKECCGCTACLHVCPVGCISMQEDSEGFLYPVVEKNQCIQCHQCENVCPVQKTEQVYMNTKTFVGYNRDEEIRQQSSSGGIFSAIAEWILQQNGVVVGAAFDKDFEVHHIAIETKEELEILRGSKYVQSRMDDIYPAVKKYLEMERQVLFTGTACQIAGLKKYLKKEYDNLYTVDVLCHGVPSPKIWRMYLDEVKKQYHSELEKIEFRNKEKGWKNYLINIQFSDGQQYSELFYNNHFMKMFLDNIDLRPSCYGCKFKSLPRISDMTIGDSWGIENCMPEMDDDKGTSVILVHSLKGETMFEAIRKNLIVREARLDWVLPPTAESRKSVAMHPNRKKYWEGVKRGEDFENLCGYVPKNFLQRVFGLVRYIAVRLNEKQQGLNKKDEMGR